MRRSVIIEGIVLAVAVIAMVVVGAWSLSRPHNGLEPPYVAPKPAADPFVYHRLGNARLVRAVVGGKLYIFLFRHVHGVWMLVGTKSVTELTS